MKVLIFSNTNLRKVVYCLTVFAGVAAALWFVAGSNPTSAVSNSAGNTVAVSPAATFPGTGVGAIPDGLAGTPPQYGAPLVVSFAVAGVSGPVTDVSVSMTLTHTWVGDVDVILRAPGGTPSMVVVSRIGVTTATSFGSANDYSGTYVFTDTAAGANIWTAAATNPVPAGTYRTTAPGQAGQTNPAPVTSLNTTFGGMTPAAANGTWTLSFRDAASADIGTVTAASLTVNPTGVVTPDDAPVDMNGDGLTDFVIVRNTGGGPGGQITWMTNLNGIGPIQGAQWGLQGDEFVPADYDGDDKDDIAVWRPLPGTGSTWYVLNSATQTARVEQYGLSTDDPSVVDDYDGDNKADLAVYRSGTVACPAAGCESNWFYRTTAGGPVTTVRWGQNGDFPVPGDFNGDGKADFCVQRNAGGGQGRFFVGYNAGGTLPPVVQPSFVFGASTDVILPGDYDGDDKTDICVIRGIGGQINWFYHPSDGSADVLYQVFGNSATDFPVPGDYDGDGRIDLAVWRPDIDPTQSFFFFRKTSNGAINQFEWGQNGDYPPANYNNH
jgi:subtilisin-like proprotein convertase family protein